MMLPPAKVDLQSTPVMGLKGLSSVKRRIWLTKRNLDASWYRLTHHSIS
jgi:hypothetical protein